jgi:hypothetical protein
MFGWFNGLPPFEWERKKESTIADGWHPQQRLLA